MYSNTTGCLYCVPCKLFHPRSDSSFCKGFNDWKNCIRLKEHEQNAEHRFNIQTFVLRGNVLGKIDSSLHETYLKEIDYWHRVLKRVVDVIKFLGTRGLSFRGTNEIFGALGNGNFMRALELVAEYDDFLKHHIETKGNPGSGKVSYLSKTICDEFIEIMYKKIMCVIIEELKRSKYYSLSVDSIMILRKKREKSCLKLKFMFLMKKPKDARQGKNVQMKIKAKMMKLSSVAKKI